MNRKSPLSKPLSFPTAFRDTILFSNRRATANRLSILQKYKLTQQQKLDIHALKRIFEQDKLLSEKTRADNLNCPKDLLVRWKTIAVVAPGDIEQPFPEARAVSLEFNLNGLVSQSTNASKNNNVELLKERVKLLVGAENYDADRQTITLSCDSFPFSSQNKQAVIKQFNELIASVQNESLFEGIDLNEIEWTERKRKVLTVPQEWLKQISTGEPVMAVEQKA